MSFVGSTVGNTKVLFDRILRLTFTGPNGSYVLEYAPRDNPDLCPAVSVTCKDIINPLNKTKLSAYGYTADITIYNPEDALYNLLVKHSKWSIDYAKAESVSEDTLRNYYANRLKVRIEAGYWNSDDNASDHREYKTIFYGYVNSSSDYRQGVDEVLQMGCFAFDTSVLKSTAAKTKELLFRKNRKTTDDRISTQMSNQKKAVSRAKNVSGRSSYTYMEHAKKLYAILHDYINIENYDKLSPTLKAHIPITEMGKQVHIINKNDREVLDWIVVRAVKGRSSEEEDTELYGELGTRSSIDVQWFNSSELTYEGVMRDFCTYGDLRLDYVAFSREDGIVEIRFWRVGESSRVYSYANAPKDSITITNYQNLIEAPSMSAAGALNIKMIFNPDCVPAKCIALRWDKSAEANSVYAQVKRFQVKATSLTNYMATQQVGAKSISVAAQRRAGNSQETQGYIYNTYFPMQEVVHTLETRGNNWYTSVKTIPRQNGLCVK